MGQPEDPPDHLGPGKPDGVHKHRAQERPGRQLDLGPVAAQGCSNREAADELVVSIKTIEYHLRNAFHKLGVTSRRQLPDRLAEVAER